MERMIKLEEAPGTWSLQQVSEMKGLWGFPNVAPELRVLLGTSQPTADNRNTGSREPKLAGGVSSKIDWRLTPSPLLSQLGITAGHHS